MSRHDAPVFFGADMFRPAPDREAAKAIFARAVSRIELETHSYCNRRCSYCPNVVGDRIGPNVRMEEAVWRQILGELTEIDYARLFVLNSYNEPLADRAILDRIREARAAVPKARIMLYTNGDYLDAQYVRDLAEAGLHYMHISIHLQKGDTYSDMYGVNRMMEISARTGIAAKLHTIRANDYMIARMPHKGMEIEMRAINFMKHGTDRGGLIEEIKPAAKRTAPCHFPFAHFHIGFSGNIVPCCHVRSDRPEHAPYLIGNIAEFGSIYQAFASETATSWRRELAGIGEKRAPCDTCTAAFLPAKGAAEAFANARRRYVGA